VFNKEGRDFLKLPSGRSHYQGDHPFDLLRGGSFNTRTILIVDDDYYTRHVHQQMIE